MFKEEMELELKKAIADLELVTSNNTPGRDYVSLSSNVKSLTAW
jgi:hypothetical protein